MSFLTSLYGLDRGSPANRQEFVLISGMSTSGTRTCIDHSGEPVICPGPASDTTEFDAFLAGTSFDPAADYHAVGLAIEGPRLVTPGCHLPINVVDSPCGGPAENPDFEGVISPDPWLRASYPSPGVSEPESVPNIFPSVIENGGTHGFWPEPPPPFVNKGEFAYLVNPAPVWVFPDGLGNEFGQCLFTTAQLPTFVSINFSHTNRFHQIDGNIRLGVIDYYLPGTGPPPPEGSQPILMGAV